MLAFLDVHPCSKGHTVIVPKKHVENLSAMDGELWNTTLAGVQQALKKVYTALKPDGVNMVLMMGKPPGKQCHMCTGILFPATKVMPVDRCTRLSVPKNLLMYPRSQKCFHERSINNIFRFPRPRGLRDVAVGDI